MRGLTSVATIAALAGLCACAPQKPAPPADADTRDFIVGAWHPAADSDDFGAEQEEVFAADGTYTSTTYRNARCTMVTSSGHFKWSVDNGVLLTSQADSTQKPSRDQILVLDAKHLKTRSLEDQQIYSRDRGYLCATRAVPEVPPAPHQTDDKGIRPPPPANKVHKPKFGD